MYDRDRLARQFWSYRSLVDECSLSSFGQTSLIETIYENISMPFLAVSPRQQTSQNNNLYTIHIKIEKLPFYPQI